MRECKNGGQQVDWKSKLLGGGKGTLRFLFWAILFGVSYTQPPLYYSNQNQYFLHGLAQGGLGFLNEDWLANTADPTPVFSALVALTYRYLSEFFFYIYYVLILGAYFHALYGIFTRLSDRQPAGVRRLGFIALLVGLHSALLRWSSAQLFGVDYPWYFQAGVANQYILGAGLQPSVFGVLLVVSVCAFLNERPYRAVIWSSLAAVMHSTYLLSAAFLTLSYVYVLCRAKRFREAFSLALWALALVSPLLVYNLRTFSPSIVEMFREAQHLLARFRIPHHAEPDRWLDGIAYAQIGWVLAAIVLVRGRRLFPILLLPFVLSFLLTLAQLGTDSDSLALLFPWRTSSILVPIATTVILTKIIDRLADFFSPISLRLDTAMKTACAVVLVVLVVGGAAINYFDLGYRTDEKEAPLLEFIRANKARGEVYLLPIEVPKLTSGRRGAASLNFTRPPKRDKQSEVISVDLQRFRLFTGAPIYVDFKSIPYKDVEVLEWRDRVLWNQKLYEERDWNRAEIKAELARRHITHVVTTTDRDIRGDALELLYEDKDKNYRLYRLKASTIKDFRAD
jgi:hypothetical protein